mmetsp:Transcript_19069/g.54959  ORF Transcript_19069/g.54959 Transcript_19069/m.54959 type:complete len:422 (+) Transcript_19069:563-1828(+)
MANVATASIKRRRGRRGRRGGRTSPSSSGGSARAHFLAAGVCTRQTQECSTDVIGTTSVSTAVRDGRRRSRDGTELHLIASQHPQHAEHGPSVLIVGHANPHSLHGGRRPKGPISAAQMMIPLPGRRRRSQGRLHQRRGILSPLSARVGRRLYRRRQGRHSVSATPGSVMQHILSAGPKLHPGLVQRIVRRDRQLQRNLVGAKAIDLTVVFHGETIIQQEAMVALLSVGVIDLGPSRYALKRRDGKGLPLVVKGPLGLPRPVVIEHVGIRDQGAGPVPVDLQAKVAAAHAHPGPLELVEGGNVGQLRGDVADGVVVLGDRLVPVGNLRQEVRTGQLGQLVVGPEDGHVGQGRGEDVVVRDEEAPVGVDLAIPQEVDHEEDVLGRVEVEVGQQYRLPDGRLLSHLHRDEALARHGHAHRVGR